MTLFFLILAGRLAYLQIYRGKELASRAINQRMLPQTIDAQRGNILDRNYKTLALSLGADALYAIPDQIKDIEKIANQLAPHLDQDAASLIQKLQNAKGSSMWLARGLTPETAEAIRNLQLSGIRIIKRPQRYYPQGSLASHVLGIAGSDNQGLEGIEYYYDEILRGSSGQQYTERDAYQRIIPGGETDFQAPQAGHHLVLTLDAVLQHTAEVKIKEAVLASSSDRGLILVMDPNSGEILVNAIYPTFDPNDYQAVSGEIRRNVAITDQYEPGSTFKFVTTAASLDLGLTHRGRIFESGAYWEIGGGFIRNNDGRSNGTLSFLEAIERSDNIVFAKLSTEMGPERFHPIIRKFGFGERTGIDFPGEIRGTVLSPTRSGQLLQWANIGFGQGIAVTPIQLLNSISAIANGGSLMKPYFVKEIRNSQGKLVQEFKPEIVQTAISSQTAQEVRELLRSAVVNGNANRAEIAGYYVAGKTGTAEVPKEGVYGAERIASFAGFAPVDDPALAALVILYNPKGETAYGGVLAAPVFKEIMEESLEYFEIKRRQVSQRRTELIEVPNVVNFSRVEAEAKLIHADLRWIKDGDGNFVEDQTPSPGTLVPPQTMVRLFFYEPNQASEIVVPNFLNLNVRDAALKSTENNLRIKITGSGIAYEQSPQPGSKVPKDAVVEVKFKL